MTTASPPPACWPWHRPCKPLGKVTVLAPDRNWSASGHVKTLHRPLRVKEVAWQMAPPPWLQTAPPLTAWRWRCWDWSQNPSTWCVSGINPYANVGHDLTYSGTVTAAMEAAIFGLPAAGIFAGQPR